jgi:hypothetical protein
LYVTVANPIVPFELTRRVATGTDATTSVVSAIGMAGLSRRHVNGLEL